MHRVSRDVTADGALFSWGLGCSGKTDSLSRRVFSLAYPGSALGNRASYYRVGRGGDSSGRGTDGMV